MSRGIKRIIFALWYAILYGLIIKYLGFKVALITILVMIYIELFLGSDKE